MQFAFAVVVAGFLGPTTDDADWERSIGQGYEANRKLFTEATLRFHRARGEAKDIGSARVGQWSWRVETDGFCAFDGERGRYETVYPLAVMTAKRKPNNRGGWDSPIRSFRNLTDGKSTLFDHLNPEPTDRAPLHTSQINAGSQLFYDDMLLPIDIGRPEPRRGLMTWMNKSEKGRPLEDVRLVSATPTADARGKELVVLVYHQANSGHPDVFCDIEITIDLEKGCIPIETLQKATFPKLVAKEWTILGDLRKTENGGWLPYRYSQYRDFDKSIEELVIIDADFKKPADSVFRLEFEEPLKMVDGDQGVTYPAAKIWDLAHLPSLNDPAVSHHNAPMPGASAPAMPGELESGSGWYLYLLLAGCVLFVGAIVAYRRRS